jgi:hypothetical protein
MAGSLLFVGVVHLYGRAGMFFKMPENFLIEQREQTEEQLPLETVYAWEILACMESWLSLPRKT